MSLSGAPLALVTGSAGAIGAATVDRLLETGHQVVGLDRAPLDGPKREGFVHVQVDLQDESAVRSCFSDPDLLFGLRHLIGIAGGALPNEPRTQDDPLAVSLDLFRDSIEANLTTQFLAMRAALPWLKGTEGVDRSITFTSSFNALTGCGMPAYSAAKAGLIGMMHALATPLGREGIRVNVVAPGTIRTPRTDAIWGHAPGHFDHLEAETALGRLGSPDDVARAFVAVATQLTHMTGQVLVVDGGQMVRRGNRLGGIQPGTFIRRSSRPDEDS